jgi:hypothetical protein
MKKLTVKKVALSATALLITATLFLWGPSAIHAYYRTATPEEVMKSQLAQYSRLEKDELLFKGEAKIKVQKQRYQLFLWFHTRNFPIDESDEPAPIWQPWSDLIQYWDGDDGSQFFPPSS